MLERSLIEARARALRHAEIRRLTHEFSTWLGDFLRTRHETMLRRCARQIGQHKRLKPVNGMPA